MKYSLTGLLKGETIYSLFSNVVLKCYQQSDASFASTKTVVFRDDFIST